MKKLICTLAMLASASLFGANITINLVNPAQLGGPGSTLTFNGSLTNTTSVTQFLNNAQVTLVGFTADTTPFFNNTPLSLAGLTTDPAVGSYGLFTITIPTIATGTYNGTFTVFGGPGANDQTTIGTANFSVTVTPEPATWALMLTALAVFAASRRLMGTRQLAPASSGK